MAYKNRADIIAWREKHREQQRKWQRDYSAAHLEERRLADWVGRDTRRREAIKAYGGKCACCGETEYKFLTIDHEDGGGTQHREKVGKGAAFYCWLKRNSYPKGFRVLCYNCNCAFGHYGYCPHHPEIVRWTLRPKGPLPVRPEFMKLSKAERLKYGLPAVPPGILALVEDQNLTLAAD